MKKPLWVSVKKEDIMPYGSLFNNASWYNLYNLSSEGTIEQVKS